jgi:hypothetical protein
MSTTKELEPHQTVLAASYSKSPQKRYTVTTAEELAAKGLLVNTTELAKLLGYSSRNTIEKQRNRDLKYGTKTAPPAHYLGKHPRYYLPEIYDWLGLNVQVFPNTKAKMDAIAKALEASVQKKGGK